jgi:rod shape-determining protein MreD
VLKKYPFYTVSVIVLAIVQHFFVSKLVILGSSPDILGVFIAFTSVMLGQRTGTSYGFASGLFAGFLSGNLGLSALIGTIEGFVAGYFHVPEESHATSVKKRRMFYFASGTAIASGNLLLSLLTNPLAVPVYLRLPSLVIIGTLSSMLLTVLLYQLLLKKLQRD